MSRSYIKGTHNPKMRSEIAVSARFQTGAGKHGATNKRQKAKQDRRKARMELR